MFDIKEIRYIEHINYYIAITGGMSKRCGIYFYFLVFFTGGSV